ncbi:hypothetical protein DPMN_133621 [Dreissena polymorpha]|uniref:Uncharacterized protein n=1 Tax=Dreissena polymorpha TaxID=45954 RepID=A0A9D4FVW4_DREPO|nr:hypothetical protein DPMN_133621 [Dreissena polymorpha]
MRDPLRFWIVVFMIGTSFSLEPSCPICSKYDFVEQLLERVIRNEFALKDALDKITATHSKVVDTLKKIDEKEMTLNESIKSLRISIEWAYLDEIMTLTR